jgi:hypothetical protein
MTIGELFNTFSIFVFLYGICLLATYVFNQLIFYKIICLC